MSRPVNNIPPLTQYCLLAAIPIMALPHIDGLPWWVFAISAYAFCWQLVLCRWSWSIPPAWLRVAVALLSMVLIVNHYRSIQNLDAYVALLLTMHAQKTLEIRSRRDVYLTVFIGLFCISTRLLYVQSLYAMLYALLALMFLFFSLHSFYTSGITSLRSALRTVLGLLLKASPLVLVLFFLFPRIPPLIVIPDFSSAGVTGVSDSVAPGMFSALAQSEAPAFRVSFSGANPPARDLYWRGIVLEQFDGSRWTRGNRVRPVSRDWLRAAADEYPSYHYTMTVEPSNQHWLFTLATAMSSDADIVPISGFNLASRNALLNAKVLALQSVAAPLYEQLDSARQRDLVRLASGNDDIKTWALALAAQYPEPTSLVAALSDYFRSGFKYSLAPPLLGERGLDAFMFDTKIGYCEHFASAAALVLRVAGVPARVVVGYMGGEKNPYDNYILVRQLDAHAWVEYWQPHSGWQRFDPTAVVAPERILQGSEASLRQRNEYRRPLADIAWLRSARYWADSLNHQWTRWFLEYDQRAQFGLLQDVTGVKATLERLLYVLLGAVAMVSLPFIVYSLARQLRRNIPLGLSLALCSSAFQRAGLSTPTDYRSAQAALSPYPRTRQLYQALYAAWDSAWYQGRAPGLAARMIALWQAGLIFMWSWWHPANNRPWKLRAAVQQRSNNEQDGANG